MPDGTTKPFPDEQWKRAPERGRTRCSRECLNTVGHTSAADWLVVDDD